MQKITYHIHHLDHALPNPRQLHCLHSLLGFGATFSSIEAQPRLENGSMGLCLQSGHTLTTVKELSNVIKLDHLHDTAITNKLTLHGQIPMWLIYKNPTK